MGPKINPELVNKVKETSKQIYNKIPEKPNFIFTRKRIFIGICIILGLIIIGSFGEEETKETKVSSDTSLLENRNNNSSTYEISSEDMNYLKICLRDNFFTDIKNTVDWNCVVHKFQKKDPKMSKIFSLMCRKLQNPHSEYSDEEMNLVKISNKNQDLRLLEETIIECKR